MWNRFFEPTDLEDRKKLRAVDAAQLIITLYLFTGAALLKSLFVGCNDDGQIWLECMFFGNLLWMFHLLISLIGKYKSEAIRKFLTVCPHSFLWPSLAALSNP